MDKTIKLYRDIQMSNNQITTAQMIALGYSKNLLTRYVREGVLERISHGVYAIPDGIVDDMRILQQRSDKIIFSHETALFLNGISQRTPFAHSVTIPSDTTLSKDIREDCICYYVKPELYSMGLTEKKTTFGNTVRCYNVDRTICDLLRNQNQIDKETVISAVKSYAIYDGKDLKQLADYAVKLRVHNHLKRYLEVLL